MVFNTENGASIQKLSNCRKFSNKFQEKDSEY